ncbi:7662_t:CDS:2 [Paraglomus occultum]|uniref:7662_t:CDS:1 n=1 Tax=Paraglomus occultum TaxID=144539 RepID=A0A9N9AUM2_9GLOM|nr:7662_t:CDS:2 [Paraglomus occultum]
MTAEPSDSTTSTAPKPTASDANTTYQQDYSWKLPMTPAPPRLKPERKKSEYQREFAWPSSPAPSPAPATPEPQKITNTNDSTPAITESTRLNAVRELPQSVKTPELRASDDRLLNASKHNGSFVVEPAPLIDTISPVRNDDSWSNSLRKDKPQELGLDEKTKKIVALEANRLSKKSRSQSMYSLHDQLKVLEAAEDLTNPLESEYRREFVNWTEYGKFGREDGTFNARSKQPTLRRRGSWSAPLPAPLRWLDSQEKLQPTIPNSQSIRAPVKQPPPRPKTSAEFRDYFDFDKLNYTFEPRLSRDDFDERSITQSDKKYSSSPLRSGAYYDHLDNRRRDGDDILTDKYDDRRSDRYDDRRTDRPDDRRTERYDDGRYDDRRSERYDDRRPDKYDDRRDRDYDDRRNDKYDDRRDRDYDDRRRDREYDAYDDRRGDRYDRVYDDRYERSRDREYPDRYERPRDKGYDDRYERTRERGYDDKYERSRDDEYDDRYERPRGGRDYDDRRSDAYDARRHEREYQESRADSAYSDRRRDREYDDRRYGKSHDNSSVSSRREDPYDDYRRDRDSKRDRRSDLVYEDSRGDKVYEARRSEQDSRSTSHSTVLPSEDDRYGDRAGYSRSKHSTGGSRDETAHSASYVNNSRTRSSQSSLSSVSTPSTPATPNGYDTYESRTKRSSDIDSRSYKEQLYSSTSSKQRSSNIEDDRDRYSNYSRTSQTPLRKGFTIGDDDEPIETPSRTSRRQHPTDSSSYRDSSTPRGRQTRLYERSPASSAPQSFASSPARSPSPPGEYRRYHHSSITSPNLSPTYSSRPPSRATSVSSHATSIEEESAVLTDMLRIADSATLRSLTDQLSIFRTSRDVTRSSIQSNTKGTKSTTAKSTKSTPVSKPNRSSLPTTTTRKASSVRSGVATPRTSSSAASSRKSSVVNGSIPRPTSAPVKTRHKPPSSAASSISSIGSSRSLGATSFSEAREALSRARMKVEEMLELVSNGNYDV